MYITVDGLDGCGKSSLCDNLVRELTARGHEVVLTREPRGTELGKALADLIFNQDLAPLEETLAFCAARVSVWREIIQPALAKGKMVVSDRSFLTNLAYQPETRDLVWQTARALGCYPDLAILLDCPAEVARARRFAAGVDNKKDAQPVEFYAKIRKHYREVFAGISEFPQCVLNGTTPAMPLCLQALDAIASRVESRRAAGW